MSFIKDALLKTALNNPNYFGEALREVCFVKHRDSDFGCYSTFDLTEDFKKVDWKSELGDKLLKVFNDHPYDGTTNEEWLQDYPGAVAYSNGNIHVAWYWDGDGELLVVSEEEKKAAINTDCKKNYNWKWIKWE